ncbi:ABC transporter ATP-binding protein [Nocardioides rotundus]|uniref:ABC transporter ATP-binding protein n=1 Tax=Nocardioides rotundus TaxID=1774216 RepID=UPI001CBC611C|nr:ABC transporter ATP-binding protein [Nocardioides rotundus]UAL29155.1 ABC transporter ATP-binding protein [Nocardioides rotundus]
MTSTSETQQTSGSLSGAEIRLEDITKKYPGQRIPAVNDLSLTVPAGEIVMFIGPSGCGKTTSLKMINRLIEPTSGTITIGGESVRDKSVDELRRHIGYVIQGGSLFPHMTVEKNIAMVPKMLGWSPQRTRDRVQELLDMVGLDPSRYARRYPRELSGGQQQRVGVARGLAADPPVVLMDEPFGAVDPITRVRLQDELLSIQRELGKTIVCVTHDIDEAIKLGDRILILQEGAQIAQYDTPDAILAAPANEFVEDFVGAGTSLKQLSLTRISDLDLRQITVCRTGDAVPDVVARAEGAGDDSVVVLDAQERPIAWPWLRQLRQSGSLPASTRENLVELDHRATLNDALDAMLTSTHSAVIVTGDRGRYLGLLDFDTVTGHLREAGAEAERNAAANDGATPAGEPG